MTQEEKWQTKYKEVKNIKVDALDNKKRVPSNDETLFTENG